MRKLNKGKNLKIVFLTYKNRSGSTFLLNKLDKFNDICSVPEGGNLANLLINHLNDFNKKRYYFYLKSFADPKSKLFSWKLSQENLIGLEDCKTNWDAFCHILSCYKSKHKPNSRVVIFKHPKINLYLSNFSIKFFEEKKINLIILIRDGRAVYASSKSNNQSTTEIPMEVNPFLSSKAWQSFLVTAKSNLDKFSNCALLIKYEDMLIKYDENLFKIIDHLGLSNKQTDSLLSSNLHENQKHLHPLVNSEPILSRIDGWKKKLSKSEISAFEYISFESLKSYGYFVQKNKYRMYSLILDWIYFMIKSIYYKAKSIKR